MLFGQLCLPLNCGTYYSLKHFTQLYLEWIVDNLRYQVILCHGLQFSVLCHEHATHCIWEIVVELGHQGALEHRLICIDLRRQLIVVQCLEPWLSNSVPVLNLSADERLHIGNLLTPVRKFTLRFASFTFFFHSLYCPPSFPFQFHPVF